MKRSSEVSMNGQTSEFPFRDFQLPGLTTTLTDIARKLWDKKKHRLCSFTGFAPEIT